MGTHERRPLAACFEEVGDAGVEWLWPGRMAVGKLTLITGEPGVGKSFFAVDLAARVSRGEEVRDGKGGKTSEVFRDFGSLSGNVFFLGGEERAGDTTKPRLRAAGADLKRVHLLRGVQEIEGEKEVVRDVDLGSDLDMIERAIVEAGGCRLLIIDPIHSFCGAGRSRKGNPASEWLGEALKRLLELATKHRFAVVALSDKGRSTVFQAFSAAARAEYAICRDGGDKRRRFFVPVRNDLSDDGDVHAYGFVAEAGKVPRMVWDEKPVGRSAEEVVAELRYRRRFLAQRFDVEQFLKQELRLGPLLSKEILEMAREMGLAEKTVRYVYRMAGGISKKVGVKEGWAWNWPEGWERESRGDGERGSGGEVLQARQEWWSKGEEMGKPVAIVRCMADIYDESEDENRVKSPRFSQDGQIGAGNFRGAISTQEVVEERGDLVGRKDRKKDLRERKKRLEQIRREKLGAKR